EGDEEPKYFLAETDKVPLEGVDGFISFSYNNRGKTRVVKAVKTRVVKALHNMESRKLEPIIP
ncbi:hypothetical protein J1N35_011320, partial [Gossypium stocksii]